MSEEMKGNPSQNKSQRRLTDPREFENNQRLAKNIIPIDPGTLLLIIGVLLLLPLLLTGFFST
ncbi:MAG: hypothetical protein ACFCU8_16700 [Thermosynechococcaceae cyanobacterium]